eukprot:CAMPEP_0181318880 /NCGR_PEP_ID=MMETSP1101-20121128/17250_1 /TAXON_ID=46948 /ORGANISM="Rhodomonas abbreviata, Strain Caron Lab Isolate" /LENGTH=102 /DNA_ID=CAMNT_0023426395 /DNA_START=129 /DNA_END=437 /DNA_ORIENTATION=+
MAVALATMAVAAAHATTVTFLIKGTPLMTDTNVVVRIRTIPVCLPLRGALNRRGHGMAVAAAHATMAAGADPQQWRRVRLPQQWRRECDAPSAVGGYDGGDA